MKIFTNLKFEIIQYSYIVLLTENKYIIASNKLKYKNGLKKLFYLDHGEMIMKIKNYNTYIQKNVI